MSTPKADDLPLVDDPIKEDHNAIFLLSKRFNTSTRGRIVSIIESENDLFYSITSIQITYIIKDIARHSYKKVLPL